MYVVSPYIVKNLYHTRLRRAMPFPVSQISLLPFSARFGRSDEQNQGGKADIRRALYDAGTPRLKSFPLLSGFPPDMTLTIVADIII
jgi:hypothetical protein